MLKKFSSGGAVNGLRKSGLYQRCCCKLKAGIWYVFAAATFMLFLYLLCSPGWYLMLVLFLQVLGLLLWLYNYRI